MGCDDIHTAPIADIGWSAQRGHLRLPSSRSKRRRKVSKLPDTEPDLRSLMASIGFLLLDWGLLEKHLRGEPIPEELQPVREMRNAICHGLEAAFAEPAHGGHPFIRCRKADGSVVNYTDQELEKATLALRSISHLYWRAS